MDFLLNNFSIRQTVLVPPVAAVNTMCRRVLAGQMGLLLIT